MAVLCCCSARCRTRKTPVLLQPLQHFNVTSFCCTSKRAVLAPTTAVLSRPLQNFKIAVFCSPTSWGQENVCVGEVVVRDNTRVLLCSRHTRSLSPTSKVQAGLLLLERRMCPNSMDIHSLPHFNTSGLYIAAISQVVASQGQLCSLAHLRTSMSP